MNTFSRFFARITDSKNRPVALRGYAQVAVGWLRFAWNFFPWRRRVTYRAYVPDSIWVFNQHPEIGSLLTKWSDGNRRNNAGDLGRFYALVLNLKQLLKENVPGDFAELGVYRGNSAAVLADFAARHGRRVYLFDTFGGFDDRDLTGVDQREGFRGRFNDTTISAVQQLVGHSEHCTYVPGYFPESLTKECDRPYAFVHIDCDLYKPMQAALDYFHPRLSAGGCLILHDYASGTWEGATRAIDEFCGKTGESVVLVPDKSGTAVIRKKLGAKRVSSE